MDWHWEPITLFARWINLKTTLKRMKLSACLVRPATNELTSAPSEVQLRSVDAEFVDFASQVHSQRSESQDFEIKEELLFFLLDEGFNISEITLLFRMKSMASVSGQNMFISSYNLAMLAEGGGWQLASWSWRIDGACPQNGAMWELEPWYWELLQSDILQIPRSRNYIGVAVQSVGLYHSTIFTIFPNVLFCFSTTSHLNLPMAGYHTAKHNKSHKDTK